MLWLGLFFSGLALSLTFASLARAIGGTRYIATERLARFVGSEAEVPPSTPVPQEKQSPFRRRGWDRKLARLSLGRGLEEELLQADLKWRVSEYVAFSLLGAVMAFTIALLLFGNWLLSLLLVPVGLLLPKFYVSRRRKSRLKALNEQLLPLLDVLVGSLKAGYSFLQGLETAQSELKPPMSDEVGQVLREIGLGVSTEEALEHLVRRVGDPDLEMVVIAVLIQRRVGGNLSEVLGNISHTMRERIRIRGEIRTLTAQGRMSGIIVGLMPVVLMGIVQLMHPGYLTPLFTTDFGRLLLLGGAVSDAIGFFVIQRIVNIKV